VTVDADPVYVESRLAVGIRQARVINCGELLVPNPTVFVAGACGVAGPGGGDLGGGAGGVVVVVAEGVGDDRGKGLDENS
jgi:hypothetical protein